MPAEFKKDPEIIQKKAFNPKEHMTEEQIKAMEEAANQPEKPLTLQIDESKDKIEQTSTTEEPKKATNPSNGGKLTKKERK